MWRVVIPNPARGYILAHALNVSERQFGDPAGSDQRFEVPRDADLIQLEGTGLFRRHALLQVEVAQLGDRQGLAAGYAHGLRVLAQLSLGQGFLRRLASLVG